MPSYVDRISSTVGCRLQRRNIDLADMPLCGRVFSLVFTVRRRKILRELAEYTVSKIGLVSRLTGTEVLAVEEVFREWAGDKDLVRLKEHGVGTSHTSILYALTRLLKPRVIVETGVSSGVSSTAFLSALHRNRFGKLYSIEAFRYPAGSHGREAGWLVPRELLDRWCLVLGRSEEMLPTVLANAGSLDIFFHDSNHTFNTMWFEYESAWKNLRAGGILLSHDAEANRSFLDFANRQKIRPLVVWSYYLSRPIALAGLRM